jgi:riboflavin kinase/FMN adenylyltransferase
MQHVYALDNLQNITASMVTIGVFDGLHLGHQHLIRQLVTEAHANGLLAGVMTFHPHPDTVIHHRSGRYDLTTIDERAELMAGLGVDYLVTHPFNRDVMQIRAAEFVRRIVNGMQPCCLWVGEDFALGHKREGDVAFLKAQGASYGFDVTAIPLVEVNKHTISSTAIRDALREASIKTANDLLGRAYNVRGGVVTGHQRGRTIGFPTANIQVPDGKLIPANGVYAGWATLNGERFMAATNVGYSPTFGNEAVTVEAYLLDFDRDIYGQTLTVSFEHYLRPEMKFSGLEALIAQLNTDVERARALLNR